MHCRFEQINAIYSTRHIRDVFRTEAYHTTNIPVKRLDALSRGSHEKHIHQLVTNVSNDGVTK